MKDLSLVIAYRAAEAQNLPQELECADAFLGLMVASRCKDHLPEVVDGVKCYGAERREILEVAEAAVPGFKDVSEEDALKRLE